MRPIIGLTCLLSSVAQAQFIDVAQSEPSGDRWMYPFNSTPGGRAVASTFGAAGILGFDDHDAQFLLMFDTDADVPAGLDLDQYRIVSMTVRATVSNADEIYYDPTHDPVETLYATSDPDFQPDEDLDRPIELFPVGYRNGESVQTFMENSAFGGVPDVPPAQGARNAFPAIIDDKGSMDISNHVKERFDYVPYAIGRAEGLSTGDLVPADTEFMFELDVCDPNLRDFIASGLQAGRVNVVITSTHSATGGKGGGKGDPTYPFFYTRENALGQVFDLLPKLELRVQVGDLADWNADTVVDIFDVLAFLADFDAQSADADFNGDCVFDIFDILDYLGQL